jgi:hypothetical protein
LTTFWWTGAARCSVTRCTSFPAAITGPSTRRSSSPSGSRPAWMVRSLWRSAVERGFEGAPVPNHHVPVRRGSQSPAEGPNSAPGSRSLAAAPPQQVGRYRSWRLGKALGFQSAVKQRVQVGGQLAVRRAHPDPDALGTVVFRRDPPPLVLVALTTRRNRRTAPASCSDANRPPGGDPLCSREADHGRPPAIVHSRTRARRELPGQRRPGLAARLARPRENCGR